ncbi:sporulation protein YtfJ [Flavimobilis soli]|uniref:Sporulation protein YtfJ n=1 Tax=Flavimobilis soli TaxID=442709 RepID=A0A2A9E9N1_9MICO|nr:spore germination protein GerW family protein [Flavimobilis soli]PFG35767.1 sporulation protein YtfJ [Flavimobilis soli]
MANDDEVTPAVEAASDALTVRRAFGEPYQVDGATVIPVAKVLGGGGQGHGHGGGSAPDRPRRGSTATNDGASTARSAEASGGGGGFGVRVRPVGAYVVSGGAVTWRPALDLNRVILAGQVTSVVVALAAIAALRARRR